MGSRSRTCEQFDCEYFPLQIVGIVGYVSPWSTHVAQEEALKVARSAVELLRALWNAEIVVP